ncbi:replication factor-a protein [Schizopora paradoxa]|uniref:Replication protein A subunit n=1 Tax=Schizopora paradoxa TaxID=27342 RepID=A0A0H2S5B8_9AGAM|nr:replication factor-a protein [Schizopora paradoxa]
MTAGSLMKLLNSQEEDEQLWTAGHVIQIVSMKKVTNPGREGQMERYRLIISDGAYYTQAMLATQLNHMVDEDRLRKLDVVKVDKLTCNTVQNKRLIILLALTVLKHCDQKLGDPQNMDVPPGAESSTTSPPPGSSSHTPAQSTIVKAEKPPAPTGPVVYPIEGLSPYSSKWTIKARVTQKSAIKEYSTPKGEGRLFNVTLMDESGEIRATGFNQVVTEFYDRLQEGKVYYISKARVNLAKKKFSPLNNEYELGLERNTEIVECTDPTEMPVIKYNFVELAALENVQKDATCDVIAVVKEASDCQEFTSKTGRPLTKRELQLVDRSGVQIRLTLWGQQAEQYAEPPQAVIAFKAVRVNEYNGRSLSMLGSSMMTSNPDIPEAHVLRGWYDATGSDQTFKSYSGSATSSGSGSFRREELRTLENVKESQLGMGDKQEYFSCRATILHVKHDNLSYPACQTENCNKKVVETHEGWRCEKCDRSFERPDYRFIVSMSVADYTSQAWLQGFNDVGTVVFGMTANELISFKENDESKYNAAIHKALAASYNFTCRAKQDTYNDQTRVRYGIQKIIPLNYREEAYALLDLLKSDWAK